MYIIYFRIYYFKHISQTHIYKFLLSIYVEENKQGNNI